MKRSRFSDEQVIGILQEHDLLAPFYSFVLLLFFIYCYPISRLTVYLEKKFAVIN